MLISFIVGVILGVMISNSRTDVIEGEVYYHKENKKFIVSVYSIDYIYVNYVRNGLTYKVPIGVFKRNFKLLGEPKS